jgi:MFS family permease
MGLSARRSSTDSNETEISWLYPGWMVSIGSMVSLMFGPSTVAVLSFGLFIGPISSEFGWSRTQTALASTFVSYTVMLIAPLQGYLVDRFGPRRTILCSIPLFALAIGFLYFLPPVKWVYYGAWVLVAMCGIGIFPLSYLRVVGTWFDRRLGLAIGIANAGIGLGGALLPLILSGVLERWGWRAGFLAMGVLAVAVTYPAAFLFVREKPELALDEHVVVDGVSVKDATATRAFVLLAIVFILLGVVNTALVVHQVPILLDAGLSLQRAAAVQATFGVFVIVGRVATGFLIDYLSAHLVMMSVVVGASLACIAYAFGVSGNVAFICGALLGMLIGAEFDFLSVVLKRLYGLRSFGKLYGILFAIFQLGAGAGTALLPVMREQDGNYRDGLLLFSTILGVCASLLFVLHRNTCADGNPRRQTTCRVI